MSNNDIELINGWYILNLLIINLFQITKSKNFINELIIILIITECKSLDEKEKETKDFICLSNNKIVIIRTFLLFFTALVA